MNLIIREERVEDYQITEEVIEKVFKGMELSDQTEHELVARLRKTDAFMPELSLVALDEEKNELIGHILLSKVKIQGDNASTDSLALAPVSVLPAWQNKGIGKALIEKALAKARSLGHQSVIVLGHPAYYAKYGFEKASLWRITAPFEVPDEAFMALQLKEGTLEKVSGVVEYSSAFIE